MVSDVCNCEHVDHFPDASPRSEWHRYFAPLEGIGPDARPTARAQHVGEVCGPCARHHVGDYLLSDCLPERA